MAAPSHVNGGGDGGAGQKSSSPSSMPLAGPGTTRANRRLQLRKNGFRGKAVEQQHSFVTPNRASGSWSPNTGNDLGLLMDGASDGKMIDDGRESRSRSSSNILQEVNNSSLRRSKVRPRPKMDGLLSVWQDENVEEGSPERDALRDQHQQQSELSPACLPPDAPNLTRGKKQVLQRSASDLVRDAILQEKDKYIEHLESQLAATQTQLSSLTSPTVTQARSVKMRALNTQIRSLQEELGEWETRYKDRIQEEGDERMQVESSLKARIRSLETDLEAYTHNARELQHQLEQTRNSLAAAESANVELEKRLETFANIVALSPQKPEPTFTPFGERRGHIRRQSTMPRLPTSGMVSQVSAPFVMPTPASASTVALPPPSSASSSNQSIAEDASAPPSDIQSSPPADVQSHSRYTSEVDFAYTETASKRDSMLSATSSRLSWTLPDGVNGDLICPSTGKTKPSRRMRRFHAGSLMPKTLILSTSTQLNAAPPPPATAPLMDPHESSPAFPFPDVQDALPRRMSFDDSPLAHGRRRAYTSAENLCEEDLQILTPLKIESPSQCNSTSSDASRPQSAISQISGIVDSTPRGYSPRPGSSAAVGRNLFDELQRARSTASDEASSDRPTTSASAASASAASQQEASSISDLAAFSSFPLDMSPSQLRRKRILHQRSISEQTTLARRPRSRTSIGMSSRSSNQSGRTDDSRRHARNRLRASSSLSQHMNGNNGSNSKIITVVSNMCRQPYKLARRCVMRGENLMLLNSSSVNKVQWWLLSFLLGPMVCRRIVSSCLSTSGSSWSSADPVASAKAWRRRQAKRKQRKSAATGSRPATASSSGSASSCPCHGVPSSEVASNSLIERHSPWLWIRFSLTLAFAIGAAIKDGPASLLSVSDVAHEGRDGEVVAEEEKCTCSLADETTPSAPVAATDSIVLQDLRSSSDVSAASEGHGEEKKPLAAKKQQAVKEIRSLADELESLDFDDNEHEYDNEEEVEAEEEVVAAGF
ncbi:hypothetical protein AAFC00_006120 [Neodothiora populina]|uniref:Uncharacterized protein n=1 Tax=Neodothiora populina TaxID=2781224 RepID=A0ABR3P4D0_9PEZI